MSMRANEPRGMPNFDPRGTVGRIYVGDHLLHIKYLSSGPHGFRKVFLSFFIISLWAPNLDPRGLIGRIYVGNQ